MSSKDLVQFGKIFPSSPPKKNKENYFKIMVPNSGSCIQDQVYRVTGFGINSFGNVNYVEVACDLPCL